MDKEDMVNIHHGTLLGHKKDETVPFVATRIDLEGIV